MSFVINYQLYIYILALFSYSHTLDVDECTEYLPCMQRCVNTEGSFICTCFEGFQLESDGRTCHGEQLNILLILHQVVPSNWLQSMQL